MRHRAFLGQLTGGSTYDPPLYISLLTSYLRHFVPILTAPHHVPEHGVLLLQALSQFWLCQNAPPSISTQLSSPQPFNDTKASVLTCLEHLVTHLNAHERQRIAYFGRYSGPSAHSVIQAPIYHFFDRQLHSLPDISARVVNLIRLLVLYLQPWRLPTDKPVGSTTTASAPSSSTTSANGGGGGAAAADEPPSGRTAAAEAAAEAWPWSGFVRANYLLYARLLVSVARETRLSRFRLTEKRDLQMLKEVAALFDTPHVFTLLRGLGEGIEQLLVTQALPQASPLHQSLIEQLTIFEVMTHRDGILHVRCIYPLRYMMPSMVWINIYR